MRNRNMPAYPIDATEGVALAIGGLTKREAAAIAIRAGDCDPPLVTVGVGEACQERRMSAAEYAVREADALFDELNKDSP